MLPENLADADIIAYTNFEESVEALEQKLKDIPLWNSIPAVQKENVYYYSVKDTIMNYDYASQMITIDKFVDDLLQLPIANQ